MVGRTPHSHQEQMAINKRVAERLRHRGILAWAEVQPPSVMWVGGDDTTCYVFGTVNPTWAGHIEADGGSILVVFETGLDSMCAEPELIEAAIMLSLSRGVRG